MSEKTNNGFDEAVRALLKDAQEEVPSRVWENLSSGSAAAHKGAGRLAVPFALIAAAASVALVLVLRPAGTTPSPVASSAASPSLQICEESYVEAPEYDDLLPVHPAPAHQTAAPEKRLLAVTSENTAEAVAIPDHPASQSAAAPEREQPSAGPETVKQEAGGDVFAKMEMDDAKAKFARRPQLSFCGSIVGSEGSASLQARGSSGISVSEPGQSLSETSVSTFGVPFTLGAGVRFEILPRFFIGTGLDYSFLSRTFSADYRDGGSTRGGDVRHSMHYLGIPLMLSYDFVSAGPLSVYVDGGGRIEWCLSNSYAFRDGDFNTVLRNPVKFPQASVSLGLGAEYRFTERFGLYLEPNVRYYFYCSQPKNIRTERPLIFDLNLGVRFSL